MRYAPLPVPLLLQRHDASFLWVVVPFALGCQVALMACWSRSMAAFWLLSNLRSVTQEMDDWLEEYRTKFTEMSGMKKPTEGSEGSHLLTYAH